MDVLTFFFSTLRWVMITLNNLRIEAYLFIIKRLRPPTPSLFPPLTNPPVSFPSSPFPPTPPREICEKGALRGYFI